MRAQNSSDNKCNKQFCFSLAEISTTRICFHIHGNLTGNTGPEVCHHESFFHVGQKLYRPTPVSLKLEIKLKEVLNGPFFGAFCGLWRTSSAWLGSARLGSARLGSARLSSARLD